MSDFDPQDPPSSAPPGYPGSRSIRAFTTSGGVEVKVNAPRARAPRRASKPREPARKVLVLPEGQPIEDQEEFIRALAEKHGATLERMLLGQRVRPTSVPDMRQRVLLVAWDHVQKATFPRDTPSSPDRELGFLAGIVRNEARNYRRLGRLRLGGEEGAKEVADDAPSPASDLELAKQEEKLARYISRLPDEEKKVIEAVVYGRMTHDQAAVALNVHRSKVGRLLDRAEAHLEEMRIESEQATRFGAGE